MHKILLSLSAVALLTGCSVESETWVTSERVSIQQDQFTDTFETAKLNGAMVHAVADHYARFGNGPLKMVVSYDTQSKVNTRGNAQNAANIIQSALYKNGVRDVQMALSEMRGSGDVSTTLISFNAITASAPKGCGGMMPGYDNPSADIPNDTAIKPPYKYGCTVESLLARQVARPSDLMGKQGFETNSDGRRAERVLSTRGYYGDKENKKLSGETASDKK